MKPQPAFGLFRLAQSVWLLVLSAFLTAAAFAQSVNYYKFTPPVIRSTETQNVLLEVRISGAPTRVALDFDPAGSQPLLDLLDNGTNGDRQSGRWHLLGHTDTGTSAARLDLPMTSFGASSALCGCFKERR